MARARTEPALGDHFDCVRLGSGPVSAATFGSALAATDLGERMNELSEAAQACGLVGLGETITPASLPVALNKAEAAGLDVRSHLQDRVKALSWHSRKGSLKAVASALRAWHGFATLVLGYGEEATLPPRSPQDVLLWLACFKSGKTAKAYVSNLFWACTAEGIDTSWHGERLTMLTNGILKVDLKNVNLVISCKFLLKTPVVEQIVDLADGLDDVEFSVMILTCWYFLTRVQSEVIPLEFGTVDEASVLPAGRHSSVHASPNGKWVGIRWAKRKNRSGGSYIRRMCTCATSGAKYCVAHRFRTWELGQRAEVGEKAFQLSEAQVVRKLRRYLTLLQVAGASQYTLKSFRAGRATEMAALGYTLPAILEAGEWRSRAVFNYLNTEEADHAELLRQSLEASDDENLDD